MSWGGLRDTEREGAAWNGHLGPRHLNHVDPHVSGAVADLHPTRIALHFLCRYIELSFRSVHLQKKKCQHIFLYMFSIIGIVPYKIRDTLLLFRGFPRG